MLITGEITDSNDTVMNGRTSHGSSAGHWAACGESFEWHFPVVSMGGECDSTGNSCFKRVAQVLVPAVVLIKSEPKLWYFLSLCHLCCAIVCACPVISSFHDPTFSF